MDNAIEVIGAKQNNLKNISVEIPQDKLTVITGVSGSGKSSLAFDIIYGEAQRRFLKSVSNYAKGRIGQLKKPNVDYVRGLSPVIAIEQKKSNNNPRSTVGTVTDINDYLRLLFATIGTGKCSVCGHLLKPVSTARMAEYITALPRGTVVEIYTTTKKVYGEDYEFLFERVRKQGYKQLLVDGQPFDLSEKPFELDEGRDYHIEILLDRMTVKSEIFLQITRSIEAIVNTLEDEVMLRLDIKCEQDAAGFDIIKNFGCPQHHYVLCELQPHQFSFNVPASACDTCMGVGSSHIAEPRFIVRNPHKSINGGALHHQVFRPQAPNSYRAVLLHSLSVKYGFSLDTPFDQYPDHIHQLLFYGNNGEKVEMINPPHYTKKHWLVGRKMAFAGFVKELEREYRNYIRKAGNSDFYELSFVRETMIEKTCPDCSGSRLKASRLRVTVGGMDINTLSTMQFPELVDFLVNLETPPDQKDVADSIIREITSRLQLLVDIGLHYLSLGRRSDSISGGEMQRIKMSTQISSELRGILYVMDEPSIGLHPRDSNRTISIMKKLRDIGNTVVVVEHDLDTMHAADYLVEIGPGAGTHGGNIITVGSPAQFMSDENCLSGTYMSGKRSIPLPAARRKPGNDYITLQGAQQNNLKNITVDIPLGLFICVTGVSGSGKSTLIFETLSKHLEVQKRGARIVPGKLDYIFGYDNIKNIITIDQSPIGRNRKSNPATYIGVYDRIRKLFASVPEAAARGYTALDFSLTHKGGARCEHCTGDGILVTNLQFMADIETPCPICKGSRFSKECDEIRYNGKNIAEILEMTAEEAQQFFCGDKLISHKLGTMNALGLGYLTLGQSATTLSGGEAQRVKLSYELGKIKRGSHNLYILDEPTTGLHCADVEVLLASINKLVDQGHSVIVVEHNLDIIKSADFIIDMGPEGGQNGGYVVAAGTPEEVAGVAESFTGQFLKGVLGV
ncbi:MAG: excinuclease ABC subunit UvrA [Firmicutes bacterium]|nr:excinuclease ABC subunit UvrA [Bacillota bacterium]